MLTEATRWSKHGKRCLRRKSSEFDAFILGAPAPLSLWAWGVWTRNRREEGIEFSLSEARKRANLAIYAAIGTVILMLSLSGCVRVRAYNARVTAQCRERYSEQECRPLPYPACENGLTGIECR